MTFDPVYGAYFGPVVVGGDSHTSLQLAAGDSGGNGGMSNGYLGGTVSVLAGTGAGQYRRIVTPPEFGSSSSTVNSSEDSGTGAGTGTGTAPDLTVEIERPFTTPLDSTSLIQVGPFKGRFIFHNNRYEDGGGFQTYGNAHDVIISKHKFARTENLVSWGRGNGPSVYSPNLRIQFLDNTIEEGNHLWNWNATYPYPHPKTIEPYSMGVLGSDQDPQPCMPYPHGNKGPCPAPTTARFQGSINHHIIFRRNAIENNGGVVVRGHTQNVIVEGTVITNSSVGIHVNGTFAYHVLVVP